MISVLIIMVKEIKVVVVPKIAKKINIIIIVSTAKHIAYTNNSSQVYTYHTLGYCHKAYTSN